MESRNARQNPLVSPISRRSAIKLGGIAAVGLAFSKPVIQTITPGPAFAQASPPPTIQPQELYFQTICPYLSTGYKYRQGSWGHTPGFEAYGFDDSGWATGNAGFGGGGCPIQVNANTPWNVYTDMLIRKHFNLPAGAHSLEVGVAIDNNMSLYINGNLVASQASGGCAFNDMYVYSVPDSFLNVGDNVVAVRGHDYGVEAYLDIEIRGVA